MNDQILLDKILEALNVHPNRMTEKIEISPTEIYRELRHLFKDPYAL